MPRPLKTEWYWPESVSWTARRVEISIRRTRWKRSRADGRGELASFGGTFVEPTLARAHAFLRRKAYVTPEDVKAVAYDVLRHRITLTYEAEAEEVTPEKVVSRVLEKIEVP